MPVTFNSEGNPCPYGILTIDMVQLQQIFTTIPDINKRTSLLRLLQNYIDDFNKEITPLNWFQWIGGSYVTTKLIPNDIDLVNFIDPYSAELAVDLLYSFITNNKVNPDSMKKYSVDGYLVPIFDSNDPRHHITVERTNYWQKWLGHDRNNKPKAIIEVIHK